MNSIDKLKELKKELEETVQKKQDAAKSQKYEEAVDFRNKERTLLRQVERVFNIDENVFDEEILKVVKSQLFKIIYFIEDEDTNLTPALIRKLVMDVKEANQKNEDLKLKISNVLKN